MADILANHVTAAPRSLFAGLFAGLGNALVAHVDRRSRREQIERLHALDDDELAARGLCRDEIVAHVFRDRLLSL